VFPDGRCSSKRRYGRTVVFPDGRRSSKRRHGRILEFHALAAATGNAQLPIVERHVDFMSIQQTVEHRGRLVGWSLQDSMLLNLSMCSSIMFLSLKFCQL